jgi:hypothetical protein
MGIMALGGDLMLIFYNSLSSEIINHEQGMRNAYNILVRKPEGKILLGRPGREGV